MFVFSWIKRPVAPGVAVAMMGICAFAYMLAPADNLTPLTRGLWIAAICFLGAAEIGAIYRANAKRDKEYREERKLDQERFEATMERLELMREASAKRFNEQMMAFESHRLAIFRLDQAIHDPVESLKKRALQLSEAILDFIYERIRYVPPLPNMIRLMPGAGSVQERILISPEWKNVTAYEKTTIEEYKFRFSTKVREMRDSLSAIGLVDEQLESLYQDPKESGYIRIIGERLGELAGKIIETKVIKSP